VAIGSAWNLLKDTITAWVDDYAPSMGAALAYYTVFSVAPLLLIVIAVAGLVFGQEASEGEVLEQLQLLMGEKAAAAIQELLRSVHQPASGTLATVVGAVVLLIGATTVFAELQNSLDRIWRAPARNTSGIWNLVRARLLSFGMILAIGFMMIVSLVASAALAALASWYQPYFGSYERVAAAVDTVLSFAFLTVSFALIYKIIPRVTIGWGDVWLGALVTAVLFSIGKLLIGLYIGKTAIASTFGAAASVAVLLIWVYYAAQIFLLGAEFTRVYAHTYGSLKGKPLRRGEDAIDAS
jgi:membrane protein